MRVVAIALLLAFQQTIPDLLNQMQTLLDRLRVVTTESSLPTVPVGSDLQATLDRAPDGTTIQLAPGTYPVNLILRAGKTGITIRTAMADPVLVAPWIVPGLPLAILVPADPLLPIVTTEAGAHDYTLALLEIGPNLSLPDRGLVDLGTLGQTTLSSVPYNINIDRCYIHGSDAKGGHRGVMLNTRNSRVTRSYINNLWEQGRDAQAILMANGPGPFAIEDNFLEASGENIMAGGADPKVPNLIPSDITIRRNYLTKRPAWKTKPGSVKNTLELKNAQRVLIEDNLIENTWADGQPGFILLLTVRNQDGGCPWCTVKDVEIRQNIIRHGAQGVSILGKDTIQARPSVKAAGISIHHNLFYDIGVAGGNAKALMLAQGVDGLSWDHNTMVSVNGAFLSFDGPQGVFVGLKVTNNIWQEGAYGIQASCCALGAASFAAYAPDGVFGGNVIVKGSRTVTYPPTNTVVGALGLDGAFNLDGVGLAYPTLDGTPAGASIVRLGKVPLVTLTP